MFYNFRDLDKNLDEMKDNATEMLEFMNSNGNLKMAEDTSETENLKGLHLTIQTKSLTKIAKKTTDMSLCGTTKFVTIVRMASNSTNFIDQNSDLRLNSDKAESDTAESVSHEKNCVPNQMRAYVCIVCNKAFSQPNYLNIHMHTHNGVRPFKCKDCSQSFTQRANLLRHGQTHSRQKAHLCDHCGKAFIQKVQCLITKYEVTCCWCWTNGIVFQ